MISPGHQLFIALVNVGVITHGLAWDAITERQRQQWETVANAFLDAHFVGSDSPIGERYGP